MALAAQDEASENLSACFALTLLSQNLNYNLPWGIAFLASLSSVDCSFYHSTQRLAHGAGVGKYLCSLLFFQTALPSFSSALPVVKLFASDWVACWASRWCTDPTPHHSLLFLEGFSSGINVPFSHATCSMLLEDFTTPSNGMTSLLQKTRPSFLSVPRSCAPS